MLSFPEFIRSTRLNRGLTLTRCAEISGISTWRWRWLERSIPTHPPSPEDARRIATTLDVPLRDVYAAAGVVLDEAAAHI